jgi:4-hydroxy-tetrahydrodipicolinate reductase
MVKPMANKKYNIMKIAIVGYGKMGQLIAELAEGEGHIISHKINIENADEVSLISASNTDVAIEFTSPETAFNNVKVLLGNRVPTVCGSTGWNSSIKEAELLALENNTAFIWASNYSVGVNLFFAFTSFMAQKMSAYKNYYPQVHEVHHTAKKDAPSGTAITTAEKVIAEYKSLTGYTIDDAVPNDKLLITHARVDPAPGFHEVIFDSEQDTINLQHNAKSRNGFANGALLAAKYIYNKKGVFTINEVLGI